MTDSAIIEHLREINNRLAEQVERLESELIKERVHSRRLSEQISSPNVMDPGELLQRKLAFIDRFGIAPY